MADATDSKSVEGNFIRVRLPSSAPEAKTALAVFFEILIGSRTRGFVRVPLKLSNFKGEGSRLRHQRKNCASA